MGSRLAVIDIEFVCTGNQCRSPMAAAFLRRRVAERALPVTVTSSGSMPPGKPAAEDVVEVLAARGLDVTSHRSRTFDAEIIAGADLVLGMERHHLTELVAITPEAYTRCFTLPEFVHRLEGLGLGPDERLDLAEVVEQIALTRGRRDLLRVSSAEEIPDPIGRSRKVFEKTADRIADLVDRMVDSLWPVPEGETVGVPG